MREEFPRTPLDQLRWFCTRLGIEERRMIRLMGLSPTDTHALDEAVREAPDAAIRVVELLLDLVDRFNFDTKKLSETLHQTSAGITPGAESKNTLLKHIIAGGPDVVWDLLEYLRLPDVETRVDSSFEALRMWTSVVAQTRLYRVSRATDVWPDPVRRFGSFFNDGGRYNVPHQQTVYASADPFVALTESKRQTGKRSSIVNALLRLL
jgi:hypothetical protein